ncbi:MAG: NUDIX domain-containing protein [Candidatus Woesearchaeota archaeon]
MNQKYQKITVAGLLIHNNNVLIVKRSEKEDFLCGYYELPGGKVDFNEHPEEALIREFKEETNLNIIPKEIYRVFTYISHEKQRHTIELVYLVELNDKIENLKLSEEHNDFKFISLDELNKYKLSDEIKLNIKLGLKESLLKTN